MTESRPSQVDADVIRAQFKRQPPWANRSHSRFAGKVILSCALFLSSVAPLVHAQAAAQESSEPPGIGNVDSARVSGDTVTLHVGADTLTVQVVEPNVLRVHYHPNGQATPATAVLDPNRKWSNGTPAKIDANADPISISTGEMIVKISKIPLQSRIDWERFAVKRDDHTTFVRPFPISVDMRESPIPEETRSPYQIRAEILKNLGINARFLGVGVDRLDYTKGIIERFRGVERFLEKNPFYIKHFTFVQIGAPSRSSIPRYQDFTAEVEREAARINERFGANGWKPIALLIRHHSHSEILPYYRAADLCMVTSLHDGMNLVAKEFVAARDDEQGALILSQFTGAMRELPDALIVNPYDTEAVSEAIRVALEMDADERQMRMQRMRRTIRENNVYRWAGTLINELAEIRIDDSEIALKQETR